jgi:tRNA pseudouridine55 synthase
MTAGVLIVDKPGGMTSHDVVNVVRGVTGIRKVGHAGALDPLATGVLLLCVGPATRLAEYLTASDKVYEASVRLGVETDTYDADGQVLHTQTVNVSREQVTTELEAFRGAIQQVPPMFSAVKHAGRPLYRLAREGVTVDRKPRSARVTDIAMTDWSPPLFSFRVACSAGTYVRTLAHDLGLRLGCGAHITRLVRTASGPFRIEDAVRLSALTQDNWLVYLQPMEAAVAGYPAIVFDRQAVDRLTHGQNTSRLPAHPILDMARACTPEGSFFALVRASADNTQWVPHKVFGGGSDR